MNLPTTRRSAVNTGSMFYLTGKPCVKGHLAKRRTKTGQCVECARELTNAWKTKNSERVKQYEKIRNLLTREYQRERQKVYRANNPDKRSIEAQKRRVNHKERLRIEDEKYYQKNADCIKKRMKIYHKNNPYIAATANAKRRALINTATLSFEEKGRIAAIYRFCRFISNLTGVPHEVDHIKPLSKGGKHHPENLQIITKALNRKKGAKLLFNIEKD